MSQVEVSKEPEETTEERLAKLECQFDDVVAENRALRRENEDIRAEFEEEKKTLHARINKLQDQINGNDPSNPRASDYYANLTTLEKYHEMPQDERERLLSSSDRRAVVIFENWRDWAKNTEAGWVITTKDSRDRKNGKSNIKADLKTATGEDLRSIEVYRAMRAVAKLSTTDEDSVKITEDEYGRGHITGGAFEFHDKSEAGTSRRFKVLILAEPEEVTLP